MTDSPSPSLSLSPAAWAVRSLRLMRPRQWPILSAQLAVGMVLATGSFAPPPGGWLTLAAAWMAWVVMLNGGTLAFNSAYDRDTGPVAYLPRPPAPPPGLAPFALAWMLAGAMLGALLVSPGFGLLTGLCVVLSWLYSHPRTRWKSRPGLDLLVNMTGYGFGTTAAGLLAGRAAATTTATGPPSTGSVSPVLITAGFGLLFGSFYPLTQIYQRDEDLRRGDRTLATALGTDRSLILSLVLGATAAAALLAGFGVPDTWRSVHLLLAAALGLWLGHGLWLLRRRERMSSEQWERVMYRALGMWAVVDIACLLNRLGS